MKTIAPSRKPGSVTFAREEKGMRNEVHVGPLRSTPLGLVLLAFLVIAMIGIFFSFFTGNLGAMLFWIVVEGACGGAFLWDRAQNLPKQPQA